MTWELVAFIAVVWLLAYLFRDGLTVALILLLTLGICLAAYGWEGAKALIRRVRA